MLSLIAYYEMGFYRFSKMEISHVYVFIISKREQISQFVRSCTRKTRLFGRFWNSRVTELIGWKNRKWNVIGNYAILVVNYRRNLQSVIVYWIRTRAYNTDIKGYESSQYFLIIHLCNRVLCLLKQLNLFLEMRLLHFSA